MHRGSRYKWRWPGRFFIGGAKDQAGAIYLQNAEGKFIEKKQKVLLG
ncbi:MAG: hypothetical protein IPI30_22625 [Saprospiraceae bacterium]|nr:hypothetical protein [Candidatus Vicinibacter affinis]